MKKIPTWILVVAVGLYDRRGRILLQQRLPGKRHEGRWEFPGGKVETGETPRAALVREIAEELDLVLDASLLEPCHFAEESADPAIVLNLYTSRQPVSEPRGLDGQAWNWFTLEEAADLSLAPMDRKLLAKLAR